MGPRNFIQETIDTLRIAAIQIDAIWRRFQAGEMTKQQFEDEYRHIIADNVIDTLRAEPEYPNNGCKYSETNPNVSYFVDNDL